MRGGCITLATQAISLLCALMGCSSYGYGAKAESGVLISSGKVELNSVIAVDTDAPWNGLTDTRQLAKMT
jgi:hypothetical protein